MFLLEDVNLLTVLVAAIVSFVLGSLWYSPLLFGDIWMKLAKIKPEKKDRNRWLRFLVYFIVTLVMAFVLAHFLLFASAVTYVEGLVTAFWLWLGFVAPITIGGVLWEKKSIKLFALNNAYNLISMGLMAVILVLYR